MEHKLLDVALHDATTVGAGGLALLATSGADQAAFIGRGVAAAAVAAFDEAAKEGGLAFDELVRSVLGALGLAATGRLPKVLIDDAQVLDGRPLPLATGAQVLDAFAGARILAELGPVPDLHAGVEFGLQDAVAALARAVDRRGVPFAAARARFAIPVQLFGDRAGCQPADIAIEDAADHGGLRLHNLNRAARLAAVAVHCAARGETALGVGAHATLSLGAEIAKVVLRDQTLECDVHRLDLVGRESG